MAAMLLSFSWLQGSLQDPWNLVPWHCKEVYCLSLVTLDASLLTPGRAFVATACI